MTLVRRVVVRELTKTFGSTVALRGVDAVFEAGKVTSIEGTNGSGKSTLLGIVGTALRGSSGRVDYEPLGERLFGDTSGEGREADVESVRAAIGWVSHEALAYPDLSGRQNVELAARLHGLSEKEAFAAARERFGLGAFVERPVRTYSRGQRQRVALARALVHEPSLVLLDEPTTGLDRAGIERLAEVLKDELERGSVVVVVTHDPAALEGLIAGRVVLDRGRVVSLRA